jgi:hypothetical protein
MNGLALGDVSKSINIRVSDDVFARAHRVSVCDHYDSVVEPLVS